MAANSQKVHDFQMTVGYYGDVIFIPGVKIGIEKSIRSWVKTKPNKTKYKSIRMGGDLIYYRNKNHHHGLIIAPSISYKRFRENGKFFQFKLSSGLHKSITDGLTYQVENAETIRSKRFTGQYSYYGSISLIGGRKINERLFYYVEFGLNGRYPFNKALYKGVHTSFGIQYSLN